MPNTQGLVVNLPDMVLGFFLVIGLFLGLFVGLFRQAIVLAVAYAAALIASRLYVQLGPSIPLSVTPSLVVRSAIAFGLLFVLLIVLLSWLCHYIPNPIGETSKLVFFSGRVAAAMVGFVWAFLIVGITVTVLVLAVGGSWGPEQEPNRLALTRQLRQSSLVQALRMNVWPISQKAQDFLPLGPFLPE